MAACQSGKHEILLQWMTYDVYSIFFSRQIQQGMSRFFFMPQIIFKKIVKLLKQWSNIVKEIILNSVSTRKSSIYLSMPRISCDDLWLNFFDCVNCTDVFLWRVMIVSCLSVMSQWGLSMRITKSFNATSIDLNCAKLCFSTKINRCEIFF